MNLSRIPVPAAKRARVELPPGDIDPASGRARLSYRQAQDLFKTASGGATAPATALGADA